ncbi:MAG: TonB-dependent receptor, partial [Bacteroidota bacterium]
RAQRRNLITGEISPATTRYPDEGSRFYSMALYANYKWNLGQKIVFHTGARYSVVRLKAGTEDSDVEALADENPNLSLTDINFFENLDLTNQAVTGSIGVVYNPNRSTKLSGIVSSGFRAPNVDDIGKVFEVDDNTVVIPNPDLEPEYTYNQEVSLEQGITKGLSFKIVAFHSLLTNAIVRGPVTFGDQSSLLYRDREVALRSQVNAERARVYGGLARVDYTPNPAWSVSSSININEGKELGNGQPLRHATPVFGRTSVQFSHKQWTYEVFSDYNATRSADNIPDAEILDKPHLYTDTGSPGWATLNLRLGYAPTAKVTVQGGMENILDKHYRTYSSGISAPGRNLYASIRASF